MYVSEVAKTFKLELFGNYLNGSLKATFCVVSGWGQLCPDHKLENKHRVLPTYLVKRIIIIKKMQVSKFAKGHDMVTEVLTMDTGSTRYLATYHVSPPFGAVPPPAGGMFPMVL